MTDAELASIRAEIGTADPPSDADLSTLFDSLGTVQAVVLAVLNPRLQDMLSKPAKYTIEGDSSFDFSANIAALQKKVGGLQTSAGGLTVGRLERTWER